MGSDTWTHKPSVDWHKPVHAILHLTSICQNISYALHCFIHASYLHGRMWKKITFLEATRVKSECPALGCYCHCCKVPGSTQYQCFSRMSHGLMSGTNQTYHQSSTILWPTAFYSIQQHECHSDFQKDKSLLLVAFGPHLLKQSLSSSQQ